MVLHVLTKDDCSRIHNEALHVLETIGIKVTDRGMFEKLTDFGALFDERRKALLIPEKLVKWALEQCPKSFEIANRKGEKTQVRAGGETLYYTSNGITYSRGQSKKIVKIREQEFSDFVVVANQLKGIDGLVGTCLYDYAPQHRDFVGFALMAKLSYKHLRPCIYTPEGALAIIEMADAILGGMPLKNNMFFTLGFSIVSPLTWTETALKLFSYTAGHGIPMMINSEPMAGATSPATIAGSLVLADAEILSGILINQILEPGRPIIYNAGFAHAMDMRTGLVLSGAPESALLQAGGAAMAAYHNLPSAAWSLTDSAVLDGQAAYEKLMTMLTQTLCKTNMVWGIGNMEVSRTINPETAIMDDEIIRYCKRLAKGIPVNDETLAADVIKQVNFSGDYLTTDHTMRHFREAIWSMELANRFTRNAWEDKGSLSIEEKAAKRADDILSAKLEYEIDESGIAKLNKIQKKWMEKLV